LLVATLFTAPGAGAGEQARAAEPGYDRQRLLAGHLLRRAGFGPTPQELEHVLRVGLGAYVDEQLNPSAVDDSAAASVYEPLSSGPASYRFQESWYLRMRLSRRQLLEKTTLFWHKHFATSSALIRNGSSLSHEQELMLRENAFASFRTLLARVTRDRAMLVFLGNDGNDGQARDAGGNPIPPNENYARELLQLFSMGPTRLELDGTPVVDADGRAVPNYSENDVREIARALTGWITGTLRSGKRSKFRPALHDAGPKVIFGKTLAGRPGKDGALEVEDVVDLIMEHPSTAPFMARALILDFATETPTPGYVSRVARVFQQTGGDVRATLRALLLDPEFTSDAAVRTQFKTPIEHVLGIARALGLGGATGNSLDDFARMAGQEVYRPPSVFSFYAPGEKASLVTTYYVQKRDEVSASVAFGGGGSQGGSFDAAAFLSPHSVTTPEQAVDALADTLLTAPLAPDVRAEVLAFMNGEVTEAKVRGAAWLVLCSPDFQLN
jgi:uncharacterized protein (DUF1800 family)